MSGLIVVFFETVSVATLSRLHSSQIATQAFDVHPEACVAISDTDLTHGQSRVGVQMLVGCMPLVSRADESEYNMGERTSHQPPCKMDVFRCL